MIKNTGQTTHSENGFIFLTRQERHLQIQVMITTENVKKIFNYLRLQIRNILIVSGTFCNRYSVLFCFFPKEKQYSTHLQQRYSMFFKNFTSSSLLPTENVEKKF